jgi:hypothetical protein
MEIPWGNPPPPDDSNTFSTSHDPPLTPCTRIPKNNNENQPILTENDPTPFDHWQDDFSKLLNDERNKLMIDLSQSFQDFIMEQFPSSKQMKNASVPHSSEPNTLPPKHLNIKTSLFPDIKTEFPDLPFHQHIPKLIVDSTQPQDLVVSLAEVVELTITLEIPTMATNHAAATQQFQLAEEPKDRSKTPPTSKRPNELYYPENNHFNKTNDTAHILKKKTIEQKDTHQYTQAPLSDDHNEQSNSTSNDIDSSVPLPKPATTKETENNNTTVFILPTKLRPGKQGHGTGIGNSVPHRKHKKTSKDLLIQLSQTIYPIIILLLQFFLAILSSLHDLYSQAPPSPDHIANGTTTKITQLSRNRALETTALIIARLKEHETKSEHKYGTTMSHLSLLSPTVKNQNTPPVVPTRFNPRTINQTKQPSCNSKHTWIRCNDLTSTDPIDRGPSPTMATKAI